MRTNIEIDGELLQQAMRSTGAHSKKAVLDAALRPLVETQNQVGIHQLRGKVQWDGNLNASREGQVRGR